VCSDHFLFDGRLIEWFREVVCNFNVLYVDCGFPCGHTVTWALRACNLGFDMKAD
jgi:hypothetical protein